VIHPALVSCVFVDAGEYAGVRLTAAALATEWAADSQATAKKYKGKHLVVTGEVAAKQPQDGGAVDLVLKTGTKVKVVCVFPGFEKDATKGMRVGQTVTAVGEFTLNFGGGDEVALYYCLPLTGAK
jgi:tRNA_anti-like